MLTREEQRLLNRHDVRGEGHVCKLRDVDGEKSLIRILNDLLLLSREECFLKCAGWGEITTNGFTHRPLTNPCEYFYLAAFAIVGKLDIGVSLARENNSAEVHCITPARGWRENVREVNGACARIHQGSVRVGRPQRLQQNTCVS